MADDNKTTKKSPSDSGEEKKKSSLLVGYVNDRRNILCAVIAVLLAFGIFVGIRLFMEQTGTKREHITAAFIYNGDESTPYSANFIRAARQLESAYDEKVDVVERFNVPYDKADEVIDELAAAGCDIVFTNSDGYGETAKSMAQKYPSIEFCAATCDNANDSPALANYHNFMGEIYQGRYLSGVAAGAKLGEMIQNGTIDSSEAVIGFVAAYPCAEVISGYTAFLLGARSQCPSAVMKVKYIGTWSSYSLEKRTAEQLIAEGCVIISHDTDTIGSAIACENAAEAHPVYHVSYNQDMIGVAPTTALGSCRIEWSPYIISAVEALLDGDPIEKHIDGRINGCDASGGIKEGWVKLLELNNATVSDYTKALVEKETEAMAAGKTHVFKGSYTGAAYDDPSDTIDLSTEYFENSVSSAPTFKYVLKDILTVEE